MQLEVLLNEQLITVVLPPPTIIHLYALLEKDNRRKGPRLRKQHNDKEASLGRLPTLSLPSPHPR